MHDISRLSIYRQFKSASKKQWAEAKSVYPFFADSGESGH